MQDAPPFFFLTNKLQICVLPLAPSKRPKSLLPMLHVNWSQEAPFFTEKLQIRVLPCVIVFINGVAAERLVGFDHFGNNDDFKTAELAAWLVQAGGVTPQVCSRARHQCILLHVFRVVMPLCPAHGHATQ